MKRYWLFLWAQHDDGGPMAGLHDDYDNLEVAKADAMEEITDMVTIVDTQTGDIHENHICERHRSEWKVLSIRELERY